MLWPFSGLFYEFVPVKAFFCLYNVHVERDLLMLLVSPVGSITSENNGQLVSKQYQIFSQLFFNSGTWTQVSTLIPEPHPMFSKIVSKIDNSEMLMYIKQCKKYLIQVFWLPVILPQAKTREPWVYCVGWCTLKPQHLWGRDKEISEASWVCVSNMWYLKQVNGQLNS